MELKRVATNSAISCILWINSTVLASANGPYLSFHNAQNSTLLRRISVFDHGLNINTLTLGTDGDNFLLAISGRCILLVYSLRLIGNEVSLRLLSNFPANTFKSNILHTKFLTSTPFIALVHSHNYMQVRNYATSQQILLSQCPLKCFLYSASIFGNSLENLKIASGTVFSEVLVWLPHTQESPCEKDYHGNLVEFGENVRVGKLVKKGKGHDGSIFSVAFNHDGMIVASCSDDRNILVWDLNDSSEKPMCVMQDAHDARIWKICFSSKPGILASVSEDSSVRVWDYTTNQCLSSWNGHGGKNIWSCDINPDGLILASGCSGFGIRLWDLSGLQLKKDEITYLPSDLTPTGESEDAASIKHFNIIDHSSFLVLDEKGHMNISTKHNNKRTVKNVLIEPLLGNYAPFSTLAFENDTIAVCGGIKGDIIIIGCYGIIQKFHINPHQGKINTISLGKTTPTKFHIISKCLEKSQIKCLFFTIISTKIHLISQTDIIIPPKTVPTHCQIDEKSGLFYLGTRCGSLYAYDVQHVVNSTGDFQVEYCASPMKLHGKLALNCILVENDGGVLTCGRDGGFNRIRVERDEGGMRLIKVYGCKIFKGRDLEEIRIVDGVTLILGFHSTLFFVYNVTCGYQMMSIDCGGSNRVWKFFTDNSNLKSFVFGYIRDHKLSFVSLTNDSPVNLFVNPCLQDAFSGNEVRIVKFFNGVDDKMFATGGEDTWLRIHKYNDTKESGTFKCIFSVKKHSSVIKAIGLSQGESGTILFTAGAQEQLYAWKIVQNDPQNLTCTFISSADKFNDSQIRIMDLSIHKIHPHLHLISAACSDTILRLWTFNEHDCVFKPVHSSTHHSRCILKVSFIDTYLVSACTGGKLIVWDYNNMNDDPLFVYRAHQSGVNALHLFSDDVGNIIIASGGDDNALNVITIRWVDKRVGGEFELLVARIENAHSSCITAIRIINENTILTSSIDQKLICWHYSGVECGRVNESDMKRLNKPKSLTASSIEKRQTWYLDVPDISAMDALVEKDGEISLIFVGAGVECLSIVL